MITQTTYSKLAAEAAQQLVEGGVPLNDTLSKMADDHRMNPEQLARLCEATNNEAFNAVFKAKGKTAGADRLVDFKVANATEILDAKLAAHKEALEKTAAAVPDTFDPMWERRSLAFVADSVPTTKVAAVAEDAPVGRAPTQKALGAALEHLRLEKIACAQRVEEQVDRLVAYFRPMDAQAAFPRFAKEAQAAHGRAGTVLVGVLRQRLRIALPEDNTKTASLIIHTDTPPMQMLQRAVDAANRAAGIEITLKHHGVA